MKHSICSLKCAIIQWKKWYKRLLRTIGISEQSTLLFEQKNCYPVVRFCGTPYRLVPSQKSTAPMLIWAK